MKKSSLGLAAFSGILALSIAGCCNCGKNCPPPPPPPPPPCPMMKGECPDRPGCPKMNGECPDKPGCPMMKDDRRAPRREHPGKELFKKRMDAMRQLREKYPQEMLEIDVAIIAQEDKIDALAVKAGIDLPKPPADFRRLRVAFPKEMKELDAKRDQMSPKEYHDEIQKLQEKLKK